MKRVLIGLAGHGRVHALFREREGKAGIGLAGHGRVYILIILCDDI